MFHSVVRNKSVQKSSTSGFMHRIYTANMQIFFRTRKKERVLSMNFLFSIFFELNAEVQRTQRVEGFEKYHLFFQISSFSQILDSLGFLRPLRSKY